MFSSDYGFYFVDAVLEAGQYARLHFSEGRERQRPASRELRLHGVDRVLSLIPPLLICTLLDITVDARRVDGVDAGGRDRTVAAGPAEFSARRRRAGELVRHRRDRSRPERRV